MEVCARKNTGNSTGIPFLSAAKSHWKNVIPSKKQNGCQ